MNPIIVRQTVTASQDNPAKREDPNAPPFVFVTKEVELVVDVKKIIDRLGRRAINSRSGRCVYMDGAVKLRVVSGG